MKSNQITMKTTSDAYYITILLDGQVNYYTEGGSWSTGKRQALPFELKGAAELVKDELLEENPNLGKFRIEVSYLKRSHIKVYK